MLSIHDVMQGAPQFSHAEKNLVCESAALKHDRPV